MQSVSVIICTYNRADYLTDTLETLSRALLRARGPAEIVVVNNACTDATDEVVRTFMASHPALRTVLLHEERQGLSYARNTGLDAATGDVLCFLDDDVFVPEGWLDGMLGAFGLDGRVGCVAGRIELHWPDAPRPVWLDDRYSGILSEYVRGDRSFVLKKNEDFFGANFALSRAAAKAVGGFNTELGRKQCVLLCGEDTEYSQRIWKKGFVIAYSAEGAVRHRVLPDRLSYRWICRRYFWAGVTAFAQRGQWVYPFFGLPRLLASALLCCAGAIVLSRRRMALSSFRVVNTAGAFYGLWLRASGKLKI